MRRVAPEAVVRSCAPSVAATWPRQGIKFPKDNENRTWQRVGVACGEDQDFARIETIDLEFLTRSFRFSRYHPRVSSTRLWHPSNKNSKRRPAPAVALAA